MKWKLEINIEFSVVHLFLKEGMENLLSILSILEHKKENKCVLVSIGSCVFHCSLGVEKFQL